MASKQLPKGIRNNNPGNIDFVPRYKWQGLAAPPTDGRFCVFKTPFDGIRAIARTLITYEKQHGCNTIREIIERWAPDLENNTAAYIAAVSAATGFGPDQELDMESYEHQVGIVKAIINHENGNAANWQRKEWYAQDVIDESLRRAGVVRPAAPLRQQPESTAATGVAAGTTLVVGGAGYMAYEVKQAADDLRAAGKARIDAGDVSTGTTFVAAGAAILVAAVGFMIWQAVRRMRLSK